MPMDRCGKLGRWLALGLTALWLSTLPARAQQAQPTVDELRARMEVLEKQNQARIEALEKQNQVLQQMLHQQQSPRQLPPALEAAPVSQATQTAAPAQPAADEAAVQKAVDSYMKELEAARKKEEEKKKQEEEAQGWTIGKQTKMEVNWYNGLWYAETADKAFRFHAGGRTQVDFIWMGGQDSVEFGDLGTGPIEDGVNFRRGRLEVDGTFYEVIDFWCEWDFINTFNAQRFDDDRAFPANTPVPTDMWFTITNLPWIGNLKIGNQKPPISFEHLTSSRFLNFIERSYNFDCWIGGLDNGFVPGIAALNWFANERGSWSVGVFKNNNHIFGWNQGDGEWQVVGRMTFLPYWANQGRDFVHVGLGARYRTPDDTDFDGDKEFRYRARTLLRNGPGVQQTTLLDVRFDAESDIILVPELVIQRGPWLLQAEYFANWAQNVSFPENSGNNLGTKYFHGFYVETLYFLTGEHRAYNRAPNEQKRIAVFDRVIPDENFFFVQSCDCRKLFGRGAWQVGARYSWIDLGDSDFTLADVQSVGARAGIAQDITLGLNWFLNPNMKWQFNYIMERRDITSDPANSSDGWVHGAGCRFAWDF